MASEGEKNQENALSGSRMKISEEMNITRCECGENAGKVQTEPNEGNMEAKGKPQIRTVL